MQKIIKEKRKGAGPQDSLEFETDQQAVQFLINCTDGSSLLKDLQSRRGNFKRIFDFRSHNLLAWPNGMEETIPNVFKVVSTKCETLFAVKKVLINNEFLAQADHRLGYSILQRIKKISEVGKIVKIIWLDERMMTGGKNLDQMASILDPNGSNHAVVNQLTALVKMHNRHKTVTFKNVHCQTYEPLAENNPQGQAAAKLQAHRIGGLLESIGFRKVAIRGIAKTMQFGARESFCMSLTATILKAYVISSYEQQTIVDFHDWIETFMPHFL